MLYVTTQCISAMSDLTAILLPLTELNHHKIYLVSVLTADKVTCFLDSQKIIDRIFVLPLHPFSPSSYLCLFLLFANCFGCSCSSSCSSFIASGLPTFALEVFTQITIRTKQISAKFLTSCQLRKWGPPMSAILSAAIPFSVCSAWI